MDAAQWHAQATTLPRPLPLPVDAASLGVMTRAARQEYADVVRGALRAALVVSPAHQAARGALTADLQAALMEPPGARTMLALSAPWGVGKSTLVKEWAAAQHRTWLGDSVGEQSPRREVSPGVKADFVPVIYLTLLSESRSKDLYAQVLHFIGYNVTGAEWKLALAAVAALRSNGVRLIVIDDAHMLRTASVTGRATLNAVKHLNTELGEVGGCMVLVGANLAGGAALADPQIRTRLAEHHLRPYGADSTTERRQWQRFLKACEQAVLPYVPGAEPGLFSSQHAAYIWTRTQGYVGDTLRVLVDGAHIAIAEGAALTREHLAGVRASQRAQDEWELLTRRPASPRPRQRRAG